MADNKPILDATSTSFSGAADELADSSFSPKVTLLAGDSSATPYRIDLALGSLTETAPATDTGSAGHSGRLQRIAQRITALIALIPAALTGLGNFKVAVQEALPAGTAEIGKINEKHFSVAGATLTRPANTTPYTALDSISDNSTAGSVTALASNNISDVNDDPVTLSEIILDTIDTGPGTAGAMIRMHLFNSDPTASSGVVGGDNAAYSNKKAGWIGSYSGPMRAFSDGSKGVLVPDEGTVRLIKPASGARNVWYQLQTLIGFTPSANSTTFIPTFQGWQGRL